MTLLYGIFGCVAGFFYLKYSGKIADTFGAVSFAERFLGPGGTYTFHKLVGVLVIILSVMYMFGGLQTMIRGAFGKFV